MFFAPVFLVLFQAATTLSGAATLTNAGTFSVGTGSTITLTGAATVTSADAPNIGISLSPAGASATMADGAFGISITGNVTLGLTGTQAITAAGTFILPSISVSPTSVLLSSIGNSIVVTGFGTGWTSGTPGSPTFTVSGGTITAQTVSSAISATLTYTAPATPQSVTITDPSTGSICSLQVGSSAGRPGQKRIHWIKHVSPVEEGAADSVVAEPSADLDAESVQSVSLSHGPDFETLFRRAADTYLSGISTAPLASIQFSQPFLDKLQEADRIFNVRIVEHTARKAQKRLEKARQAELQKLIEQEIHRQDDENSLIQMLLEDDF